MAVAKNIKQARQIARKQMMQKMRLEVPFEKELNRYFRRVANEYQRVFTETGEIINASIFNQELAEIINNHYNRVSKEVLEDKLEFKSFDVSNQTGENEPERQKQTQEQLEVALAAFWLMQARGQAAQINETTTKQLRTITKNVIKDTVQQERALVNAKIAREVKKNFIEQIPGRTHMISMLETGFAADMTVEKQAELNRQRLVTEALAAGKTAAEAFTQRQIWIAILDQSTRESHVIADGQIVPALTMFTVQGEQLRFPRDYINGSMSNVAECRCERVFLT